MTTRSVDDIIADGAAASELLLAADRAGDTVEVARLHEVLNALTKEVFAAASANGEF